MSPALARTTFVALAAFLATAALLAGRTGAEETSVLVPFLGVVWRDGSAALVWWAGSIGLGLFLRRWMDAARTNQPSASTGADDLALAIAVGAAAQLALDSLLGSLGLLAIAAGLVPWALSIGGVALGILALREAPAAPFALAFGRAWFVPAAFGAMTALLLLAASSAPGWLWSSEFGGYDALSYHLVLPKEWFATASLVGPVAGNVYSALPSFVEAAFLHAMVLRGDAIAGSIACQWWAALATLATAFIVARLAERTVGPRAGAPAALFFLATPWIVVTGSLAYNDVVPCLFLAGGWLLIATEDARGGGLRARPAMALAAIAAAAVGAKPTALLFVVLPLLAIALLAFRRQALARLPLAMGVGLVVLAPWLVRNAIAYGNPAFPFLPGLFGPGTWTTEQHEIFARAHGPDLALPERVGALLRRWVAHGLGDAPPGEPWFPQWGALPALGLAGLALACRRSRAALAGLLAVAISCVAWMGFTHLESRFLLTTAIPLALGTTLLLRSALSGLAEPRTATISFAAAMVAATFPFVVYLREPVKGAPLRAPAWLVDGVSMMTGARLAEDLEAARKSGDAETAQRLLALAPTPFVVNFMLPAEARLIGIGYATPLYLGRPIATTTVWDRGDFDGIVAERPDAPERWGAALRARGFTHGIVDPVMLERWLASGWLNPDLADAGRFAAFLRANRVIGPTSDGCLVVEFAEVEGQSGDDASATRR